MASKNPPPEPIKPIWHCHQSYHSNSKWKTTRQKRSLQGNKIFAHRVKAFGFTCLTSLASGGESGICVASIAPPGKVHSHMSHWNTKIRIIPLTCAKCNSQTTLFTWTSLITTILTPVSCWKYRLRLKMHKQVVPWQTRQSCDDKETPPPLML